MEEEQTNKPQQGTWGNLPTEEGERKPKVDFTKLNEPHIVTFVEDEPIEMPGDGGVYYIYQVKENDEEKVVMTSAWGLLSALKKLTPLNGKTVKIVKKMEKGKQHFEATLNIA